MRLTKKRWNLHFVIAILLFVHLWVNVAAILIFFKIYLSVMFIPGPLLKLLRISRIIVSMHSGTIIVTVDIKKLKFK